MEKEIIGLIGMFILGLTYFRFKTNNGIFGLFAGGLSILLSMDFLQHGQIGFVVIGALLGFYLIFNGLFQ